MQTETDAPVRMYDVIRAAEALAFRLATAAGRGRPVHPDTITRIMVAIARAQGEVSQILKEY